jgi:hypothetical protein
VSFGSDVRNTILARDILKVAIAFQLAGTESTALRIARQLDIYAYEIEDVLEEMVEAGLLIYTGEKDVLGQSQLDHRGSWKPTVEGVLHALGPS